MNCPNCGSEIKENQKFCNKCGAKIKTSIQQEAVNNDSITSVPKQKFLTPVIFGVSIFAGFVFIALVIGIIHFSTYTDVSIDNNAKEEQVEQEEQVEVSKKEPTTVAEKLYLLDEYQAKYFRIIRRNDVLLQLEQDDDCDRDMEELNALFREVKDKIRSNSYLSKYEEIEERFSENPGENTVDMNIFASQHYDAVDGLLNEVYQAVKAKIPPEDFKNLVASEIKWLKDVESYKSVFESKGFGTIRTLVYTNYEINMRNFRTLLLMLYL